jgi:hypothetical protein
MQLYKFYFNNYLFIITLLLFFSKVFFRLILKLKLILGAQLRLCLDYKGKNYLIKEN